MNSITTEVIILSDRRLNLTLDLPPDCPTGAAKVSLTVEPQAQAAQPVNRAVEMFGQGKGKVWMAEDFDAPLDDFAEYM
jgi:hypothetical protein